MSVVVHSSPAVQSTVYTLPGDPCKQFQALMDSTSMAGKWMVVGAYAVLWCWIMTFAVNFFSFLASYTYTINNQ